MRALVLILVTSALLISSVRAEVSCDAFTWDVKAERGLFAKSPQDASAASDIESAPTLVGSTLYALSLVDQGKVRFAAAPGKQSLPDGAHGGIVKAQFEHAGRYRVSLDAPAWIDVVVDGTLVASRAFTGRPGCNAPHKIVEYELPKGDAFIQISASQSERVRITLTESPPAPQ